METSKVFTAERGSQLSIYVLINFMFLVYAMVFLTPSSILAQSYDFNDGTVQGWTGPHINLLNQGWRGLSFVFDDYINYPNNDQDPVDNRGSISIQTLQPINDSPVDIEIEFHSPNLLNDPEWQDSKGFTAQLMFLGDLGPVDPFPAAFVELSTGHERLLNDPLTHYRGFGWHEITVYFPEDMPGFKYFGLRFNYPQGLEDTDNSGALYGGIFLDSVQPIQSIDPDLPPPFNLIVLNGYDNAIPLAWNAPVAATAATFVGYNVYRSTNAGGPFTKIASQINRLYYRDESALNGRRYYYRVSAAYNEGESAPSNIDSGTAQRDGYVIESGWASTPPSLNGVINSTEWATAEKTDILFPGKTGTVTLMVMNDNNQLYVAIDNQRDRESHNSDGIGVFCDENLDRGWPSSSPSGEGLIQFYRQGSSQVNRYQGLFGNWPDQARGDPWKTPSGVEQMISFNSGNMQIETSIDLNSSPFNASTGDIIGMLIYVLDATDGEFDGLWPQETFRLEPITDNHAWAHGPFSYGDIELASITAVPDIAIEPITWDFGSVLIGSSVDKVFVVRNDGSADLHVASTDLSGNDHMHFNILSEGSFTVEPGATHDVVIAFKPTSSGLKSTILVISSNDPDEKEVQIELSGTGADGKLPNHWNFTERTSINAIVVLPTSANPNIDGTTLFNGDYIGVFTESGLCCGYEVWNNQNAAITAWGDDDQTQVVDGFKSGEVIQYRIYRLSEQKEWSNVDVGYSQGSGLYSDNGFMVINKFEIISNNKTIRLTFAPGFNYFSYNVAVQDARPSSLFAPVVNDLGRLVNGAGDVYIPEFGIDEIGEMSYKEGYKGYFLTQTNLDISGQPVDPQTPIELSSGNSMIGYLPNVPLPIEDALASILDNLRNVDDGNGKNFIPEFGINQIGHMQVGSGYKVYLYEKSTLIYPSGSPDKTKQVTQKVNTAIVQLEHFEFNSKTGENATIVVPIDANPRYPDGSPLENGDEIGVLTPTGMCCGAVVWEGCNTAITVWGDDSQTEKVDGFKAGDTMYFYIWQKSKDIEYHATPVYKSGNPPLYNANGFTVLEDLYVTVSDIESMNVNIPTNFTLERNFPNPFNPETSIKFQIPKQSFVILKVYNMLGQEIRTLVNEQKQQGFYSVRWDGRNEFGFKVPSGVYIYRLQAGESVACKRMTLMK
jgi:hypothetical protein